MFKKKTTTTLMIHKRQTLQEKKNGKNKARKNRSFLKLYQPMHGQSQNNGTIKLRPATLANNMHLTLNTKSLPENAMIYFAKREY